MMRRILVDHARRPSRREAPGRRRRRSLWTITLAQHGPVRLRDPLLDQALGELGQHQSRVRSKIVELRYFGGLTEEEVAVLLSLSRATVTREWQTAGVAVGVDHSTDK